MTPFILWLLQQPDKLKLDIRRHIKMPPQIELPQFIRTAQKSALSRIY